MLKKILLISYLLIQFFIKIDAQKINCNAEMLEVEKKESEVVCFERDSFPNNYTTKYIILSNGNEIYEVNFSFFKEPDSSFFLIFYIDKRTKKSGIKNIKFENGSSYYIIKNYKPNDTEIDYTDRSNYILFSVPDEDEPYVILNELLSIEDEKTLFKLMPIDLDILKKHRKATSDYFQMQYIDSSNKANYNIAIEGLKSKMIKYSEEIINEIIKNEKNKKTKLATTNADEKLQRRFTERLDTIFIPYFKNIYPFAESSFIADFTFSCDGYGKIGLDNTIKLNFRKGENINWFRDSFNIYIKPIIQGGEYETPKEADDHPNLKPDFDNEFKESMRKLNESMPKLNPNGIKFTETIKQIHTAFDPYLSRKINVSTRYQYSIEYKSSVNNAVWKYEINNDGAINIIDKTSDQAFKEPITEKLKTIFRDKIAVEKKGKYRIRICDVYLNGVLSGQDIQLIEK